MIANTVKDLVAAVHLAADGSQVATGTIFCVVRLESDDADDGKFWDANDNTWQASPVAWPTGTHTQAGQWVFALPAAATTGKAGDTIHYTFTDNLTEASATTICGGGEHRVNAEDPLTTTDLTVTELAIRGADGDTLETLSDQIDLIVPAAGSRAIVLHTQTVAPVVIPQVAVSLWADALHTILVAQVDTDIAGDASLALNDGTYYWTAVRSGSTFVPDSFVVSADATHNLIGTNFVPPAPSAPNLCVVFGTNMTDAGGNDLVGSCVEAFASTPQVVSARQLGEPIVTAVTDQDGNFTIELIRGAEVRFTLEDAGLDFIKTVPDEASQDVTTWT